MDEKILSYNEIMAMFAESARVQAEFAKRQAEFAKRQEESAKRQEESAKRQEEESKRRMEEFSKKLEASRAEFDRDMAERARNFDREMKELRREIGSIGGSNGEVAVGLVFNKLKKKKMFAGIAFDEILKEVRRIGKDRNGNQLDGEYDIIMLNGAAVTLIDVKYRARRGDLNYLMDEQLPKFKKLFPKYRKFKTYLGLAGMSFEDGVTNLAKKNGVGVIRMDENTVRVDDKGVIAR